MPSRLDPRADGRSLVGRLGLGALVAFVVAVPFTLLMALVLSEWEPLEQLDRDVADALHDVAAERPLLVDTLQVLSVVTDPFVFRVGVVAVAVWLWRRGAQRLAVWAVVTAALGGILGVLLKLVVARSRPTFPEPVHTTGGFSFPSGHALNSMLCVGILLLVLLPVLRSWGSRLAAYAVGALLVLVTGYDRIGLGVHYVSDVLAGWVAALATLAGTTVAFETWRREHGGRPATVEDGIDPESSAAIAEAPPEDR